MSHYYQFVKTISASPVVLLDLDDQNPFTVLTGSSVSPPGLRRTTSRSLRSDGDLEIASSYDDREVTLPLKIQRVSAEAQATAIQSLIRVLDRSEGAWLKWQDESMTQPRFYRTRRASVQVIDSILDAKPMRTLKLDLTADPFGYGLPETGSFTVKNDPTASPNPMMYAFGAVKGDVPTPLILTFPIPDDASKTLVASQADYDAAAITAPYYKSFADAPVNATPPAGWTVTDFADGDMIDLSKRKIVKASGTALCRPNNAVVQKWSGLPPGDYRVMVRVKNATAGTEVLFFNRPPVATPELQRSEAATRVAVTYDAGGATVDWLDLGIASMPGGAPQTDNTFGLSGAANDALWNVAIYSANATANAELDCIVLIPAGRPGTIARHGTMTLLWEYTSRTSTWDGVNMRRFGNGASTYASGFQSVAATRDVTGSDPLVAPDASNVLHFFPTAAYLGAVGRKSDSMALTTVVNYSYYPRYLYARPATT